MISLPLLRLLTCIQEPNPDDPLNKEAARVMKTDRPAFEKVCVMMDCFSAFGLIIDRQNVKLALRGGSIAGFTFDKCLK